MQFVDNCDFRISWDLFEEQLHPKVILYGPSSSEINLKRKNNRYVILTNTENWLNEVKKSARCQ